MTEQPGAAPGGWSSYSNQGEAKDDHKSNGSTGSLPRGDKDKQNELEMGRGYGHSDNEPGKCDSLISCFNKCTRPCLASSHPLPNDATTMRKIGQWFLCPPSGKVAAALLVILLFGAWWGMLIGMTKSLSLPGGSLFPMLILFMVCWVGGYIIKPTSLPPLLGMLIAGCLLRNVPGIDVAKSIDPVWASTARNMALTVILTRAGLGLDPTALRKLSLVVPRLAFLPSIVEVLVDGLGARLILDLPWVWSFMLAFVMAVVSPAVVVPSMLNLSDRGYGLNKGIPTLVVASCSLDAVLAITGFGVMLGIAFSEGDLAWTVCKGPIEVLVGIAYGCVAGVVLWYFPQKSSKNLVLFRSALLLGGALLAIFGSKGIDWSGSGPLGCLSIAFVAAYRWRDEYRGTGIKNPVEDVMGVLWMVFQPLLFGLIGAAVDISDLDSDTAGMGIGLLFLGLAFRMAVAFVTMLKTDLNRRERMFIPFSWFPKATVQAAIGAIAYDTAIEKNETDLIPLGKKILNIAVLAILITAPIGSIFIAMLGPRLLHRTVEQPLNVSTKAGSTSQGHMNEGATFEDEKPHNGTVDPTTKL